ncbi:MAG: YfiR family protein [Planctomycetota bacterium]|jgi:hypothetical protein
MKKIKAIIFLILFLALAPVLPAAGADSALSKECQVKSAFIYNFIKFVDWPKPATAEADKKAAENTEPITIGIIGKNPFGKAFEALTKKKIQNRKVVIKHFGEFAKNSVKYRQDGETKYKYKHADALKDCEVLFVGSSETRYCKEIIGIVKDNTVLTVGETKGFIDAGGIIGFVTEEKKVRFGVNLIAAARAELKVRSKLLRLAKKVIEKEDKDS